MIRRFMFALGVVAFAALLYVGGCYSMGLLASRSRESRRPPLVREHTLVLPEARGTVTMLCRSKPRGIPFDGYLRVLKVTLSNQPPYCLRFPETFAGDHNFVEVSYLPEAHLIRLRDTGVREPYTCMLDLSASSLKYIVKKPSATYWATISTPVEQEQVFTVEEAPALIFPKLESATSRSEDVPLIEGHEAEIMPETFDQEASIPLGHFGSQDQTATREHH